MDDYPSLRLDPPLLAAIARLTLAADLNTDLELLKRRVEEAQAKKQI